MERVGNDLETFLMNFSHTEQPSIEYKTYMSIYKDCTRKDVTKVVDAHFAFFKKERAPETRFVLSQFRTVVLTSDVFLQKQPSFHSSVLDRLIAVWVKSKENVLISDFQATIEVVIAILHSESVFCSKIYPVLHQQFCAEQQNKRISALQIFSFAITKCLSYHFSNNMALHKTLVYLQKSGHKQMPELVFFSIKFLDVLATKLVLSPKFVSLIPNYLNLISQCFKPSTPLILQHTVFNSLSEIKNSDSDLFRLNTQTIVTFSVTIAGNENFSYSTVEKAISLIMCCINISPKLLETNKTLGQQLLESYILIMKKVPKYTEEWLCNKDEGEVCPFLKLHTDTFGLVVDKVGVSQVFSKLKMLVKNASGWSDRQVILQMINGILNSNVVLKKYYKGLVEITLPMCTDEVVRNRQDAMIIMQRIFRNDCNHDDYLSEYIRVGYLALHDTVARMKQRGCNHLMSLLDCDVPLTDDLFYILITNILDALQSTRSDIVINGCMDVLTKLLKYKLLKNCNSLLMVTITNIMREAEPCHSSCTIRCMIINFLVVFASTYKSQEAQCQAILVESMEWILTVKGVEYWSPCFEILEIATTYFMKNSKRISSNMIDRMICNLALIEAERAKIKEQFFEDDYEQSVLSEFSSDPSELHSRCNVMTGENFKVYASRDKEKKNMFNFVVKFVRKNEARVKKYISSFFMVMIIGLDNVNADARMQPIAVLGHWLDKYWNVCQNKPEVVNGIVANCMMHMGQEVAVNERIQMINLVTKALEKGPENILTEKTVEQVFDDIYCMLNDMIDEKENGFKKYTDCFIKKIPLEEFVLTTLIPFFKMLFLKCNLLYAKYAKKTIKYTVMNYCNLTEQPGACDLDPLMVYIGSNLSLAEIVDHEMLGNFVIKAIEKTNDEQALNVYLTTLSGVLYKYTMKSISYDMKAKLEQIMGSRNGNQKNKTYAAVIYGIAMVDCSSIFTIENAYMWLSQQPLVDHPCHNLKVFCLLLQKTFITYTEKVLKIFCSMLVRYLVPENRNLISKDVLRMVKDTFDNWSTTNPQMISSVISSLSLQDQSKITSLENWLK
ncbi:hypothetical protein EIN_096810 [Entamoeba invadens IP1]|uniref:Uncharacterized protein n=1 Tax=Entamoeba invadens IP1 TaxID=370355 RepID=A0A0A1U0K3_ENTIV|nr:hypothetical protein EIN_096810 [Entamoeba invadens IP1]ELP87414.1 hypothetical protein EIN_096810 [Entamoeba invadens IP1]|eukprot:XP_004254185.1 hypothetical protein EIN_096810 [Entamoeba invadens IP1]